MKSSIIHFLNLKLKRCEVTWSSWSCWVSFIKRSCLTKTAGRLGRPRTSTDHQSTKDDFLTAHWKFMKTISPNGSGKWVPPILVSFHYSGWSFHFHDCGRKGIISVKIMEGKNCFFTFQIQPFSTEPWWEDEYSTMCAFFQWFFSNIRMHPLYHCGTSYEGVAFDEHINMWTYWRHHFEKVAMHFFWNITLTKTMLSNRTPSSAILHFQPWAVLYTEISVFQCGTIHPLSSNRSLPELTGVVL